MKKFILFLFFASAVFASQYPILIFSSQNLDSFNSQDFLGLEDLIGKAYEKEISKNTIVYKIETPYSSEDTINYFMRNKDKLPIFTVNIVFCCFGKGVEGEKNSPFTLKKMNDC
jgi:hypothetical protein